ncbi:MAG TPA: hypothetical protein VLA58_01215, partial [Chitinophagaceae bacterium]|nr:hypothetical protein [Chitinophagaceae bacterium]
MFLVSDASAQGGVWDGNDTAWKGTNPSLDWVFRARNGVRIDGDSGYYLPEQKLATRTKYYINDDIPGFMEYLPAGYNDPANSAKQYP